MAFYYIKGNRKGEAIPFFLCREEEKGYADNQVDRQKQDAFHPMRISILRDQIDDRGRNAYR